MGLGLRLRNWPSLGRWLLFLSLMAAAGCAGQITSIKSLLDDPADYDGETVRVSGEVTENVGVLGYGAYRVDDGSGTITVLTREGGAPRKGAQVKVKGKFQSGFSLGSVALAVIEEESRKASNK